MEVDFGQQKILNRKMRDAIESARAVADRSTPVTITGAAGTGKTALAKWIHHLGRPGRPFVSVSCRDIRDDGQAFVEKMAEAKDGTFLIEDIDHAPPSLQNVIAECLEQEERRAGRWILTSRKDLRVLTRQEQFRQDLYYKFTIMNLMLPALQDRAEDLPGLCRFLLDVQGILHGREDLRLTDEARHKLTAWNWPGNLRELESVLERAVLLSPTSDLGASSIRFEEPASPETEGQDFGPGMSLSEVERRLILQTLELTAQNRTKAAQILGISIRTLRNKLNEYRGELGGMA